MNSEDFKKFLGECSVSDGIVKPYCLPPFAEDILNNVLATKDKEAPLIMLLNSLNSKLAHIFSNARVKIKLDDKTLVPINYYGLNFVNSGAGKDRAFSTLNNYVFRGSNLLIKEILDKKYKEILTNIENYNINKYGIEKAKLISKDEAPRKIALENSDGTIEGLMAIREDLVKYGLGATYIKISEFGDYITSNNNARSEFITGIVETYEDGYLNGKIIKSSKKSAETKGVPSNFFAHTSMSGLLNNREALKKLDNLFSSGIARRSFVCYPLEDEYRQEDFSDIEQFLKIKNSSDESVNTVANKYNLLFESIVKKLFKINNTVESEYNPNGNSVNSFEIKVDLDRNLNTFESEILTLTQDAKNVYLVYEEYCKRRAKEFKEDMESYKLELRGRYWKMLRLAGTYAIVNHHNDLTIHKKDIEQAIYVTELFGEQAKRFHRQEVKTDGFRLYNFIKSNYKEIALDTNKIRGQKFVYHSKFKSWMDENLPLANELANAENYEIVIEKIRNRKIYKLKALNDVKDEIKLDIKKSKEDLFKDIKINISTSTSISHNFEPKTIPLFELKDIMNSNINYSASQFKGNHRTNNNWTGKNDLILLDIDEVTTLEEAKKSLDDSGFISIFTPTKSHKIEKNGVIADRFRIAIPLKSKFVGSKEEYKKLIKNIGEYLNLHIDDKAVDVARFFYGNPKAKANHFYYAKGVELLDWKDDKFFPIIEEKIKEFKTTTYRPQPSLNGYDNQNNLGGFIQNGDWEGIYSRLGNPREVFEGNRSNWLWEKAFILCVDESVNRSDLESIIWQLNKDINPPLSTRAVEQTILSQVDRYFKYDENIAFQFKEEKIDYGVTIDINGVVI